MVIPAPVLDPSDVLAADNPFFEALLAGDVDTLRDVLDDDFLIVDVMAGQVTGREDLLAAVGSGQVQFVGIDRGEEAPCVRERGDMAVVVGQTRMSVRSGGYEATTNSRYTHIYVRQDRRWLMLSAQGTPIAAGS